jgi:hypothetical protein
MRKSVFFALFVLFPALAFAQITISPARIAYNGDPEATSPVLTIAGSGLAGNADTLVDFTYTFDGGVAEVEASTASSSTVTVNVPPSVFGRPGQWTVTVVAVDDSGVRVSDGATLMIFANLPPDLFVPESVSAEATSSSGANVTFDVAGISYVDAPPAPSIVCDHPSGSLFPLGTTAVTCTATDSFGSTHAFFRVFVGDTTPPVITVPAPFTSSSTTVTYTVTAVDAVSGTVSAVCSPASGTTFPLGVSTVNCSATDTHDNTSFASFQVAVQTTPAPTLTLPGNLTVIADNNSGIQVAYTVTANQDASVACTPESESFFAIGTTTVSCTATNAFGVSSTGSFTITVIADPRPTLILPADINADPTSAAGAVVTFAPTATDSVDGSIPVVCTPASGSTFAVGSTVVQCSATNSRGYSRFGSFFVNIHDGTPPVLTLPTVVNIASSGSPDGTEVDYTASAHDAVDGDIPIECEPISGALFPDGQTIVQCHATDSAGNFVSGSFPVNVGDKEPPVILVPLPITAEATSPAGAAVTYSVVAIDNFDGPVPVVCAPLSGSTFALGTTTVNCSAHDAAGNVGTASFTVTVRDTTPPVLHLPAPITVTADANCTAVVTYAATATDIVDVTDAVVCAPASGSTFVLGTTTVTCSSTDAHGNTAHGSFTVTVNDTTPPTVTSVSASPQNLWPDNHRMVDVTVTVVATDNCDAAPVSRIVSVSSNQPITGPGSGNTNPDYVITGNLTAQLRAERTANQDRTYTLTISTTDFSGNVTTTTTTVVVAQTSNHNRTVH